MSGDVQPRKRKEKKRKKDDGPEEQQQQQQVHQYQQQQQQQQPVISDDVNIHVEKEVVTGGGVCAKVVFFLLLTALAVLIGLIITEHRGLTDLDTIDTESRFSKLFAGWTDNQHDDHNEPHDDLQVPDDSSQEADEEEEEEEEEPEQDLTSEEEEQEQEEESEPDDEEGEDEEEETESVQEVDSEDVSQPEEEEEEEEEQSEETYEEEREESEEQLEEEASDEGDEEAEDREESEEKGDGETAEESEEETREERDVSGEEPADEDVPPQTSGTGSVAVKVGVGVIIAVVAYVVLVKKWKSDSGTVPAKISDEESPQPTPDLSRRNTIVPPPSLEEVEPDLENAEEEYSEEEGDQDSDDNIEKPSPAKQKYRELQSTYSRSLTPDGEPKRTDKDYYQDDDEYEEEDEEEEEEEDVSDGDDEELLKKLEAKYGKLRRDNNDDDEDDEDDEEGEVDEDDNNFFASWKRVNAPCKEAEESDSEKEAEKKTSGEQSVYDYTTITNTADYAIRDKLDEAEREIHHNTAFALKLFDAILEDHPSSSRALFGKARSLDILAENKRSNDLLQQSISAYIQTIHAPNIPDALFQTAAERCIQRMHFMGRYGQAIAVHQTVINRFPDVPKFRNQLAITYLTINKIEKAREVLQKTLAKWPEDGVALVHYGFILKTTDNKLKEAAYYMKKGIKSRQEGVIDGRFYFHLGDALSRLGRTQQAMEVYEEGVKENVFLSKYQRSLYNVPRLKGKPWWEKSETPYDTLYNALESRWREIRDEGLAVLNEKGYFKDESENLKDFGDWKQFELYARGVANKENCKKCPVTCQIIASVPDASGCKRGQSKFSVMHPGTHVWPHCGPTNCRLRVHLGLKVPPKTYIRVAEETRSWKEGKVMIFDDSFEHEVWHNGSEFRLVLIVDVWHPELTAMEKRTLSAI